jgi:hypothetical protein
MTTLADQRPTATLIGIELRPASRAGEQWSRVWRAPSERPRPEAAPSPYSGRSPTTPRSLAKGIAPGSARLLAAIAADRQGLPNISARKAG